MPALQSVKRRIRSVSGTRQITRAMQLVAASKLRRAQEAAVRPRPYVAAGREILSRLAATDSAKSDILFAPVDANLPALYIVVAGDRGLAGAYNANVMRELARRLGGAKSGASKAICIGRYVAGQVSRIDGLDELAAYALEGDEPDIRIATPVLQEVMRQYRSRAVGRVELVYTRYVSTVKQEVVHERLLPLAVTAHKPPAPTSTILDVTVGPIPAEPAPELEPSATALIDQATHQLLKALVLAAVLEAAASEQAARMLAMMNATDNAAELIDDLTLELNNARQAAITQQISEISAGAEAVS